jgi:phytol kinase
VRKLDFTLETHHITLDQGAMQEFFASLPLGSYLVPFVPTARTFAIVAPPAALYGLVAISIAGYLRTKKNLRTPYTRKVFHFLVFTMASVVQLLWRLHGVVVFGGVVSLFVFYAIWRGDGHPWYEALARPSDAPHRRRFILIPWFTTAFGGFISNVFFPGFASIGYLVCGWGDAVGEPVGSRWGKHRYRVPSFSGVAADRSLEGSVAVFVVGSAAAAIGLILQGTPPASAVGVGLACGLGGALIEAISTHGLDNLTTQIVGSAIAALLLR